MIPLDAVGKAVIAGNWKMHMTCAEAQAFASAFKPLVADLPADREVVLAPPFIAIAGDAGGEDFGFAPGQGCGALVGE